MHGGRRFYAAWDLVLQQGGLDALAARFSGGASAASYSLGRALMEMLDMLMDEQLAGVDSRCG